MNSVLPIQHSYSIYAGDMHLHALGMCGPFQNPQFAASFEYSALRPVLSHGVMPSYCVQLFQGAYQKVIGKMQADDKNDNLQPRFTGIVGVGDYFDLATFGERDLLMTSAAHMAGLNPELKFDMMVPGNHDGGQYMGSLWSRQNLFGLNQVGGHRWDVGFRVADRIDTTRELTGYAKEAKLPVMVHSVSDHGFLTQYEGWFDYSDHELLFDYVWQAHSQKDSWEAVLYYGDPHTDKDSRLSDANKWVHLQARLQDLFTLSDGQDVPVYQIGLDSQDLTQAKPWQPAFSGHVSTLQIKLVEAFINQKLKENPLAKFKLVMHYPVSSLSRYALKAMRALLSRDEIVLVISGHKHEPVFMTDLKVLLGLDKRQTALPQIVVPSIVDLPSEVVIEKMSLKETAHSQFALMHHFYNVSMIDSVLNVASQENAILNEYNNMIQRISEMRAQENQGVPTNKNTALISHEWVVAQGPSDLSQLANPKKGLFKRTYLALKMYAKYRGSLSHYLIKKGSLPQAKSEYQIMCVFLESILKLLKQEGHTEVAINLQRLMETSYENWRLWDSEYDLYQDFWNSMRINELIHFINYEIPQDSLAMQFMLFTGVKANKQAQHFYQKYGTWPEKQQTTEQLSVVQWFDYEIIPDTISDWKTNESPLVTGPAPSKIAIH